MEDFIRLTGPNQAVEILGVKLMGVNAENAEKFLFSLVFIALILLLSSLLQSRGRWTLRRHSNERVQFWTRQAIQLATAVLLMVGLISIWFDDPTRLATRWGWSPPA